jgi:hypothetical protein
LLLVSKTLGLKSKKPRLKPSTKEASPLNIKQQHSILPA